MEIHQISSEAELLPSSEYAARFRKRVTEDVGMAYGRLCVVPGEAFLKESILTVFRKSPCEAKDIPALSGLSYATLRREMFRAQIGSNSGKELRWKAEKKVGETVASNRFSRNQLVHETADVYQEHNANRTDILHEYFIPLDRFESFLIKARRIVPTHPVDLLNVTVRDVKEDRTRFFAMRIRTCSTW